MTRIYILVISLLSITLLVQQPSPAMAGPATWTVGVGGDFPNVGQALASGLIQDGDVIRFTSDVVDDWGLVIESNITINGCGYKWILNNPGGETNGLYVLDRPEDPTSFSLTNVTVLIGSPGIYSVVWTNASLMNISKSCFLAIPGTYPYQHILYTRYASQTPSIYINDVFTNASTEFAIYVYLFGSSIGDVVVDGLYCINSPSFLSVHGASGGVYVYAKEYSRVSLYARNVFLDYIGNGVVLYSSSSGIQPSDANIIEIQNLNIGYGGSFGIGITDLGKYRNIIRITDIRMSRIKYGIWVDEQRSQGTYAQFKNISIDRSESMAIRMGIFTTDSMYVFEDVYIGKYGYYGLAFDSGTYSRTLYSRNNTLLISNLWVASEIGLRTLITPRSLFLVGSGTAFNKTIIENSFLNGSVALLNRVNAWFIDTYFNESRCSIRNSQANVTWTLDIYTVSGATGQPISSAPVAIYNGSDLLVSGYTGTDGHFLYTLNYVIDDVTRTAPYLSVIASVDTFTAIWNNSGGTTLPSWYTSVVLELGYYALSVSGFTSMGFATLQITGDSGQLKIYLYIDPLNPSASRYITYDIKVVDIYQSNGVTVYNILLRYSLAGRDIWLPCELVVDRNTNIVCMVGPITMYAHM